MYLYKDLLKIIHYELKSHFWSLSAALKIFLQQPFKRHAHTHLNTHTHTSPVWDFKGRWSETMKLQVRCHLPLWNPALLKSRQDLASPGIRTNEKEKEEGKRMTEVEGSGRGVERWFNKPCWQYGSPIKKGLISAVNYLILHTHITLMHITQILHTHQYIYHLDYIILELINFHKYVHHAAKIPYYHSFCMTV